MPIHACSFVLVFGAQGSSWATCLASVVPGACVTRGRTSMANSTSGPPQRPRPPRADAGSEKKKERFKGGR